jgi:hypothetical protein
VAIGEPGRDVFDREALIRTRPSHNFGVADSEAATALA